MQTLYLYGVDNQNPISRCKHKCKRWKGKKDIPKGSTIYGTGLKYCRQCDNYIHTTKVFCPCCGKALRSKSRE